MYQNESEPPVFVDHQLPFAVQDQSDKGSSALESEISVGSAYNSVNVSNVDSGTVGNCPTSPTFLSKKPALIVHPKGNTYVRDISIQSDPVVLLSNSLQFPESSNGTDKQITVHDSSKDIRKHPGLNSREQESNFRHSQLSQFNGSIQLQNDSLNCMNTVSNEWNANNMLALSSYLELNKEMKELKNEFSAVLKREATMKVEEKLDKINISINTVIQQIRDHNNIFLELRDQVGILVKRMDALESRNLNNEPVPLDFSRTGTSSYNMASNINSSKDNVTHNETHVKHTSKSTMTSITVDDGNKLLYRERRETTVVTENCQKDVLQQSSQNKSSAANTPHLTKPQANSENTPKSQDATKLRNNKNVTPNESAVRHRSSNHRNSSPLSDYNRKSAEKLPSFETIQRNAKNHWKQYEEENSSSKHRSACGSHKEDTSPVRCTSDARCKFGATKNSKHHYYSDTSEDSDYASPNSGHKGRDRRSRLKYCVNSAYMTTGTEEYLKDLENCLDDDFASNCGGYKSKSPRYKGPLR